ncbi:hypothetical protein [Streptomyces sp. NPDC091371]|uniref:hypothetical protein n=1 Tax=Streptomyces sp. NPDC091371 TaxID=3155303 RepID=UPI0034134BC8
MKPAWVLASVLAIPLAGMTWLAWKVVDDLTDDDPLDTRKPASCTQAMHYADQPGLPAGAHDARCEVMTWLDTTYDVEFRITRTDLDTWLATAYPGTTLTSDHCYPETLDACAHVELKPPAVGGAEAIDITVQYEGDGNTALVHFQPFDV